MSTYRDSRGLLPNVRPKVDEVLSRFGRDIITHVWGPGPNPDHNNLRCCDFMVPSIAAGDQVANYLIANKDRLGVQGIIWNRQVMGFPENGGQYAGPSGVWRPYSGASPHTDHPHVQFSNNPISGGPPSGGGGTIIEITGYNDDARKLGIKAIGTVESRLTYDAINYNDPITVGVAQWYGPRAAAILRRMKDENPSAWTGVASSLETDLTTHEPSQWWTGRWLTRAEGQSLSPVLLANKPIQNQQFFDDLDGYVATAERLGMNKDTNTLAVLFFASMEHQGPLYARQVVAAVGPRANLDRIHAGALAHPVLGRYRNRQDEVKRILLSRDISGIDDPAGPPSGGPGEGGSVGGSDNVATVKYVRVVGDMLHLKMSDGTTVHAYPSGPNTYTPGREAGADVGEVKPPTNENPDIPGSADVATKRTAIRDFLVSVQGEFAYSQGTRRLNPDESGYTDCSALMYWAFNKVLGINLGTWTGTQRNNGTRVAVGYGSGPDHGSTIDPIPYTNLEIGDLIFFDWAGQRNDNYDHVEMYIGGTSVIGHGGPGSGPNVRDLNAILANNNPLKWEIRRIIQ